MVKHRYKGKNRVLQYLVQWKGYDLADSTWEDAENLENAPVPVK